MIQDNSCMQIIVYGSWSPNEAKHYLVADLPGTWVKGSIRVGEQSTGDEIYYGNEKLIDAWLLTFNDTNPKTFSHEWAEYKITLENRWKTLDEKMGPDFFRRKKSWWSTGQLQDNNKIGDAYVNIFVPKETYPEYSYKNPKSLYEYAMYLNELIGQKREFDENSHFSDDYSDAFMGYFGDLNYLDTTENKAILKRAFEPIPNGDIFFKRTMEALQVRGKLQHTLDNENLESIGRKHLNNVTKIVSKTKNKDLYKALLEMKDVLILDEVKKLKSYDLDINRNLYDTLCDWVNDHSKGTFHLGILSESFYNLSSNHYYIKYYILAVTYQHKLDFDLFEPYFQLYSNGYDCYIENNVLVISHW